MKNHHKIYYQGLPVIMLYMVLPIIDKKQISNTTIILQKSISSVTLNIRAYIQYPAKHKPNKYIIKFIILILIGGFSILVIS